MRIDPVKCTGCGQCRFFCSMRGGIMSFHRDPSSPGRVYTVINEDECVECGVCLRSGVCPTDALYQPELHWPRILRKNFSDPLKIHPETRIPGRGTEEMKTNEVTGRFRRGFYGIALELGRPGVGTRFRDVDRVSRAMASLGVTFEINNPVTRLMVDQSNGLINTEILDEKVLSAIVEFIIPAHLLEAVLKEVQCVAMEIDTVFSGDIIARVEPDGQIPTVEALERLEIPVYINGKCNVGLGRPSAPEV
ncbi:MAG: ferredoxin family protein [Deltaproteobacteria bacterium]|nr:ferredoxin family protein [Deltaproteobacteria bacterium]MBW2307767.1 ferredoxin family protein [Deltaproteobacteria bacterium]